METYIIFIILILVVITSVLIYLYCNYENIDGILNLAGIIGGANKKLKDRLTNENEHIVIDGLNLLYHHFQKSKTVQQAEDITPQIKIMMGSIVPKLKNKFAGRIMFVFKNKESIPYNEKKEEYKKMAMKHGIYIYLCQDYPNSKYPSHSSMGRDDFYSSILARLYKCRVLSYDRYYDFENFVREVRSFQVYQLSPISLDPPKLININAADYSGELQKPYTFTLETI